MIQESKSLPKISVVDQLNSLSEMADRIHSTVIGTKKGEKYPPTVSAGLDQLNKSLKRLGSNVAKSESQRANLLAIAEIGQAINSSLKLNEVLRIVMDTIIRLTGAERGFLMLRDEKNELQIRIARNWGQESIHPSDFAISHTVIDRAASEGQPILTTNAQEDPRFGGQESIIAYSLRSILCVPLKVKDEITGVIYTDNRIRSGIFKESQKDLLAAFANQAAIAIENARLFESVRSTLAEVTELKNLMANVFASIASGVITADIEDKITLCNRAAETILGQRAGLIIGQTLDEIMPPIAINLSNDISEVRRDGHQIVGREFSINLPDRGNLDLSFNISPLIDADESTQGVAIVLDDLTEKKKLQAQRRMFERMVSPAVINQLDPDKLELGGASADITTLFADIRGFTSFSESLEASQLLSILNRYLAAAADPVLEQQGTIDKFMGDAIMAWFNAPIPQPDHTLRAVRAALGIREAIESLHKKVAPAYRLSFGVGIHFGEAVLGLVGTEQRLEYTAIGDSVNTAKRIQENSREQQILISADAYRLVQDQVKVKEVQAVNAKGKSQLIQVFEVLGLK